MKQILIADDDKKITRSLAIRLAGAGYDVLVAHNGAAAADLAVARQPDLIIMDIWMPGMGLKVARQLTRQGVEIPIIFMTASTRTSLWAKTQRVGAAAYVQKPYDARKLLKTIERILSPSFHQFINAPTGETKTTDYEKNTHR